MGCGAETGGVVVLRGEVLLVAGAFVVVALRGRADLAGATGAGGASTVEGSGAGIGAMGAGAADAAVVRWMLALMAISAPVAMAMTPSTAIGPSMETMWSSP